MTPKERWRAVLEGRRPDRQLCDIWATPEVTGRLLRDLGCNSDRQLWVRLGIDACVRLGPRHPKAKEDAWHLPSLFSLWKVETKPVVYGDGLGTYEEDARHPLAGAECVADIENFEWPDPEEFDVDDLSRRCREWPDYPVWAMTSEPFYLYCRLRGMELALEDLASRQDIAQAILDRIFQFDSTLMRRVLEAARGAVDIVCLAEDLGTQTSLLMSPALFRRFFKPNMSRLAAMAHSYGVWVFHHDDGAIRPLIPDLIETGIDILNPIQWRCRGMEREGLARDFGARLVFHGGVDNQHTLPFGTPEDVRREVLENIQIFSRAKGYIVAPCHNIQPNTPTENIVALYEAVAAA